MESPNKKNDFFIDLLFPLSIGAFVIISLYVVEFGLAIISCILDCCLGCIWGNLNWTSPADPPTKIVSLGGGIRKIVLVQENKRYYYDKRKENNSRFWDKNAGWLYTLQIKNMDRQETYILKQKRG